MFLALFFISCLSMVAASCSDDRTCEATPGAALLQVRSSSDRRMKLPHDENTTECDPSKAEPPEVGIDDPGRFHGAKEAKVIVDIGGNAGTDVSVFLQHNPKARIFTFEPVPSFAEGLKTTFADKPNVVVQNVGMSNKNAQVEFIMEGVGTTGVDHNVQGEHVQVKLRDVDEILAWVQKETGQVPDLLNMNCEGCEYAVMERLREKGWLEKLRFIQLSWHLASDVEDRVAKRCKVEDQLWQTHQRTFKSGYGWVGWTFAK
jgi:FkbM family methyltransferase